VSIVEAAFAFALTVAALAALILFVWMLVARRTKEVYIAPFQVAGENADSALAIGLANMLRARLVQAQRETELRKILTGYGDAAAASLAEPLVAATAAEVRAAVEPVDVEFSVGKVSVGGLLSWAQRWALEQQTLRLTVVFADGTATVSGTLEPFGVTRLRDLWSTTPAAPEAIVDGTADAIMQSLAAEGDHDRVQAATALKPKEFGDLLWCLNQLALHERRSRFGQGAVQGAATLDGVRERLSHLTEVFPDWGDLTRLADDVKHRLTLDTTPSKPPEPATTPLVDEETFLTEVKAILNRVFPDEKHPDVVIGGEMTPGLQALWNSDSHRYEVNSANLGDPGFAADVALMGRFMAKNYDRCGDRIKAVDLWNDYRNGVVEYLIASDPELESSPASEWLRQARFFSWLQELDARDDVPAGGGRSLALVLLDSYVCSWTWQTIRRGIVTLNEKAGAPLPQDAVAAAVQELKPARG
jgi:hypothetical protein